ncbi:MAG: protoporphyrin/coproporphyrin ferrochelatase [Actinomycetota bacterium]|nr:protoporphyrin/coproporphyrin ferrochelatase [Actinomycetota bacterium]
MTCQAVLVMAYGTPRDLSEVEAYYTDIRRGRPPTPELLEELTSRYRAIGGSSPLLEITAAQAEGVENRLEGVRSYVGQKHASPFVADAVRQMQSDGVERAVGLVLAPHYSAMSVGDYEQRARAAAGKCGWQGTLTMIPSWHLEPGYITFLCEVLEEARAELPADAREESLVLFTAHSLPQRILESGDPYPHQLRETADAVAAQAGLSSWDIAWQSAGRTAEPWIGPDILEVLPRLRDEGVPGVIICPCGFVADHLEVLFDVDIEARQLAERLGLPFARTRSPNADLSFLDALAAVVARALSQ